MPLSAQSVDSLIAKYIQAPAAWPHPGTADAASHRQIHRRRRFEAVVVQENSAPTACAKSLPPGDDGHQRLRRRNGWKIEPWNGKRDPESLGEEEMHGILDDADSTARS